MRLLLGYRSHTPREAATLKKYHEECWLLIIDVNVLACQVHFSLPVVSMLKWSWTIPSYDNIVHTAKMEGQKPKWVLHSKFAFLL